MRGPKRHSVTRIDGDDRISNLPRNVIDQILSRLSIRAGARTTVLSKTWRHKWSEVPSLVFSNSPPSLGARLNFPEFASIVDHVVFLHRGTILRFKYSNDKGWGTIEHRAMDRWIMHLSKGPIKEFAISTYLFGYCLPPCLFDCQSLTQLSLSCGSIKLPSRFKGFPNLKILDFRLQNVAENDLEKLITGCPALVSLAFKVTNFVSRVNVVAPNLVFFSVEGDVGSLSFENTSRLAYVSIILRAYSDPKLQVHGNSSNLLKFCAQIPMIRKLKLSSGFLKYLAVGIDPSNLQSVNGNLESLTLYMDLNFRGDCLGARGILNLFQNLRELSIELKVHFSPIGNEAFTLSDGSIWEDQCSSCRFNNLQLVEVKGHGITGTRHELEFVKFMLSASPVLEAMVIKAKAIDDYDEFDDDQNPMMTLVKKLLSFKRASVHAQVIFENP